MKRRTFLNNAGKGLALGLAAPTILSSCTRWPNDNILVGHIGVGSMGSGVLKSWLMPTIGAFNVATCDPFLERRVGAAKWVDETYKKKELKVPKCKPYLDF